MTEEARIAISVTVQQQQSGKAWDWDANKLSDVDLVPGAGGSHEDDLEGIG